MICSPTLLFFWYSNINLVMCNKITQFYINEYSLYQLLFVAFIARGSYSLYLS